MVWFFSHFWQEFCIANTRQKYFELRDQLFLLAMNDRMDFKSQIYRDMRNVLNLRIRLAHTINFSDLISLLIVKKGVLPKTHTLADEIEKIDDTELRAELRDIYGRANEILFAHMIVRSPICLLIVALSPFFILFVLIALVIQGVKDFTSRWTDLARVIDTDIERHLQKM